MRLEQGVVVQAKGKYYTIVKIDKTVNATYVYVTDENDTVKAYGKKAFLAKFEEKNY